ncbi:type II toxin-antitoxin system VapC family toxin [Amaricoccus solimangrovi]|uniref:Ribonuclease VapC n=1 Tax=Amaricoccus solimangrovi TaxID=2589815 RepID=A0A501WF70_9RHOB|nr:type II toxin-antitoxin system VapC family toxin [Amaricoccus solimangrovi]TPE47000.1 type II toxin-antitoxin system VapC family toxin [Amaricoccus solimangrovi]
MTGVAAVVDTSALLAYLNHETGWDIVESWLDRGVAVSALNAQELTKKIVERGGTREDATRIIADLALDVRDLTLALAIEAGTLVTLTRPKGLSEGDRACLALASLLGVPAVTADRPWADIADLLGVRVQLVR